MRDEHVAGVTAVHLNADLARLRAQMFVAPLAEHALAATDPRIDDDAPANPDVARVRSRGFDRTFDLMTEREGQGLPACKIELLPRPKIEIAVVEMQVRMAYAAVANADEHFRALRYRQFGHSFAEWNAVVRKRLLYDFGHRAPPRSGASDRRECVRESSELGDRQFFRAPGRLNPGLAKQLLRINAERAQALPQHLAPLAECGFGNALKHPPIAGERSDARDQLHH